MPETSYDLSGRYDLKVDASGRVGLPTAFQKELGASVVVTMGAGNHARIYSADTWRKIKTMLSRKSPSASLEQSRPLLQKMNNSCATLQAESGNRITLPDFIRDWIDAKAASPVIFIGNEDHVELWTNEKWVAYAQSYAYTEIEEAYALLTENIKSAPEEAAT